jgi:F0F1-type ATP synthase membrane subunit b/b'
MGAQHLMWELYVHYPYIYTYHHTYLDQYNRVCHREAQAKRGYKFATLFINGCLGLQVIVAAALTAMGAANSNHRAITAFGALNTVIAGILTYLKGSGLPNRIRYYEQEWKRVREFIEQRERDFSRQDCRLDVDDVVTTIEAMYEQVKADIQTNTPDSYISVSDIHRRAAATIQQAPHVNARAGRGKLEELELKYGHKATDFLESLARKEEERLKRIEGDIESSKSKALAALQDGKSAINNGRAQWDKGIDDAKVGARDFGRDMEDRGARMAERELEHARSGARDWGQDMERKGAQVAERELEHAKSGLLHRGLSFAKDLEQKKADVLKRSDDVARGLDAVKASALQQGRDYKRDVHAKTARFAETAQEIESEAERTREAAQRAGESINHAGESLQRAGDSISRVSKAVDDEIQPHRRD